MFGHLVQLLTHINTYDKSGKGIDQATSRYLHLTNSFHFIRSCYTLLLQNNICISGLPVGLHPAHERRRDKVPPSLIGWAQT